jgi:uncharacterized protein YacL
MINYKKKKNYIIAVLIIVVYSGIGYIFNIDILKVMTISKNSFSISIIGLLICCVTAYFIDFIIKYLGKSRNRSLDNSI